MKMSRCLTATLTMVFGCWLPLPCWAQVNSGSNGSDGPFNPTANTVINMALHPNGIYQYTSVNVPANVTVTFTPNANNTPVVWLVQNDVVINGIVNVGGQNGTSAQGGQGGPGGWEGGNGAPSPTGGEGPGGGSCGNYPNGTVCSASYGTSGGSGNGQIKPPIYGNSYLIPLLGGSGGGGCTDSSLGGGGGGGAILVAASGSINISGTISANGGAGVHIAYVGTAGSGSGGAVRLVAAQLIGNGTVTASGGYNSAGINAGQGRVRFDVYQSKFIGSISGVSTTGFQPIIVPSAGQLPQLNVTSVGGVPVSASPTGVLSTPDAVLSAQQDNPILIVVQCSNLPLDTSITVSVKPANGSPVSVVGYNNTGTQASSTATVLLNMPRGGGLIYATAATGH